MARKSIPKTISMTSTSATEESEITPETTFVPPTPVTEESKPTSMAPTPSQVAERPAIDPNFVNVQVIYSPANRPGEFSSHEGVMRYPVFEDDGNMDVAESSAKSLQSPSFIPGVPVSITLATHQKLMAGSEQYQRAMSGDVIKVIDVRPNLDRATDSSLDFDEAGAIRIASITLDESWLDKSTADPRPPVMQAVQAAKVRLRNDEQKIARAAAAAAGS